ncbi:transglutaminase-like cysteine peptidase [Aureimonas leprariae]|uniref:Transglutaminase-like cysteine peptidase n=1 Tax=Plantimonas leprariae TaxID=2615207 RepID=A0A7V7PN05_9HYPH|nr:transglutaminase-like cysteine peptidase [Aureimonas leprariae]KAB0678865.1 transglutaminase-like cysteine peptidase [Aureimonas leprariae]
MRAKFWFAFLLGVQMPVAAYAAVGEGARPAVSRVAEGGPTLAPFAHVIFCQKTPGDCVSGGRPNAEAVLDDEGWRSLRRVNDDVNAAIRPTSDRPGPLGDVWSLAPRRGDCEDYAITKRHRLIALGWPPSALRLAVARTGRGEGHAVLVAKTDQGDYVLDNRSRRILRWNETKLAFLKMQSGSDPQRWLEVASEDAVSENR